MIPENPCCGLSRLFPVQLPLLSIQPAPTRHFPSISFLSQEIAPPLLRTLGLSSEWGPMCKQAEITLPSGRWCQNTQSGEQRAGQSQPPQLSALMQCTN